MRVSTGAAAKGAKVGAAADVTGVVGVATGAAAAGDGVVAVAGSGAGLARIRRVNVKYDTGFRPYPCNIDFDVYDCFHTHTYIYGCRVGIMKHNNLGVLKLWAESVTGCEHSLPLHCAVPSTHGTHRCCVIAFVGQHVNRSDALPY